MIITLRQPIILSLFVFSGLVMGSCKNDKSAPSGSEDSLHTSNAVTTYVGGLQQDVQKANRAVEKMNNSIQATESATNEAN